MHRGALPLTVLACVVRGRSLGRQLEEVRCHYPWCGERKYERAVDAGIRRIGRIVGEGDKTRRSKKLRGVVGVKTGGKQYNVEVEIC